MALTLDSVVIRRDGLMSTQLDQDVVILNPARDNYFGMDEVGRRIWELLAVPRRISDLCRVIAQEFRGDIGQITADVLSFLRELIAEDLVHVAKS